MKKLLLGDWRDAGVEGRESAALAPLPKGKDLDSRLERLFCFCTGRQAGAELLLNSCEEEMSKLGGLLLSPSSLFSQSEQDCTSGIRRESWKEYSSFLNPGHKLSHELAYTLSPRGTGALVGTSEWNLCVLCVCVYVVRCVCVWCARVCM